MLIESVVVHEMHFNSSKKTKHINKQHKIYITLK